MIPVHIAGVGMTQFGKSSSPLVEIMRDAAMSALAASKIQHLDAIYIAVMNPEEYTGDANIASHLAEALGLTGIPAVRVETASSAGAAAVHVAYQGVASGYYRHVLVIGGEKMTHLTTSASTRILAEVIDAQERNCGATMPALAAMITARYRKRYRLSESTLAQVLCAVAMKNHANGVHNSCAQFRQVITQEKYFASKFVATPLRLYDCAPMTDGAAALILTGERTDVAVCGIGQGTGPVSLRERETFTCFPATQIAARRAYQMAGISPGQIDCAEVHDAFTPFEIIGTEDLGFFPAGKGVEAAASGRTAADGSLPINASGGLKSRGHPVGASGVAQIVEIVHMLREQSTAKLRRAPHRGLAQSIGGLASNNFVTILERSKEVAPLRRSSIAPASRQVEPPGAKRKPCAGPMRSEGVIETFTIVYTTPDGFLPPLALAMIRDRKGARIMAQGEDISQLQIGREVCLHRVAGIFYFNVKNQLKKVRAATQHLYDQRRIGNDPKTPTEKIEFLAKKRTCGSEKNFHSIINLIAEELRGAIASGKIAPGNRLTEGQLALSLKVGRVPLHDALRQLEAEGYMTAVSHDQFIVSQLTLEDAEEYYSIAGSLEGLAARLAVERGSAEELSRLRELHRRLKLAYRRKHLEQYFEANRQFHRFIAQMSRNDRLYQLISEMRRGLRKARLLALQLPQRTDYSMREHDQILDAFLKRNPDLAESTVLRHLANQLTAIKTILQSVEGSSHA